MDLRAITANFGNTKNDRKEVTYRSVAIEADATVRNAQYAGHLQH